MQIPLTMLYRDPLNVRKTAERSNVEQLASLIMAAGGVLQNLVVRAEPLPARKKKPTGRFGVVAGGRRLAALQLLAERGRIPHDYLVPCLRVSDDAALLCSTAENSGREDLHGADLFEAFRALASEGRSIEQIADAWGVEPLTVRRRLRLAALSPKLLALYRDDQINLDQLIALSITDDHARQEAVWERASTWDRSPSRLRAQLMQQEVPASDSLAVFVGRDRYEAAGGAIRQDLFATEHDGLYFCDQTLLQTLAQQLLDEQAELVRAEGWAWVEARPEYGYHDRVAYSECPTVRLEPSAEQAAELQDIEGKLEALEARWDELPADEEDSDLIDQRDDLERKQQAIEQALSAPHPECVRLVGAVVYVDRGQLHVWRNLIRPEDKKLARAAVTKAVIGGGGADSDTQSQEAPARAEFPESLLRQLTAHRTAALRECVALDSAIALRVLAYQLATNVLHIRSYSAVVDRPVQIRLDCADLQPQAPDLAEAAAAVAMSARHDQWGERLKGDGPALLAQILAMDDAEVAELLAFCTASSLNCVAGRPGPKPVADAIANAVGLDMADWWDVTPGRLASLKKAQILGAVADVQGQDVAASLAKLGKSELVAVAADRLAGSRWLPSVLRKS